jgi:hypothetical protein
MGKIFFTLQSDFSQAFFLFLFLSIYFLFEFSALLAVAILGARTKRKQINIDNSGREKFL